MNKLMKRTVAFVLMVCLLTALAVPAVLAAPAVPEADGSYVIDFACADGYEFMADPGNDKPWVPRVFTPKSAYTKPDGTSVSAIASIPCSNKTGLDLWEEEYEAGTFDFGYDAAACKEQGAFQFQVVTIDEEEYTVVLYKDGTAGDGKVGWGALKIKAPVVGTYDVELTYITQGTGGTTSSRNFLIPASKIGAETAMADIGAIVSATDSKYELGTVDYSVGKVADNVADLGTMVNDDPAEEEFYFVFATNDDARRVYLQKLTLTPSAVSVNADTDYYAFGRPEGKVTIDGGIETVAAEYAAGTRNLKIVGYHEGITKIDIEKTRIYAGYSIWNAPSAGVIHQKWMAFQFRAPGTGDYTTTIETGAASAEKSGSDFHVYLLNADSVVDGNYEAAMTEANLICTSELSVSALNVALGKQTYEAGEEYVLILQPSEKADSATQAANYYLVGLDFVEIPAPAAAIGATEYLSVAEAVAAAKAGDTIKLLADHLGNIDVPAGVAIDLNGNTWTVSEYVATSDNEYVFDSVGTGALKAGNVEFYGDNNGQLALATDGGYSFADYELSVDANDYQAMGSKTRFWFKLDLADADLDKIAAGETGLTIGVELAWGEESLVVTFDNGEGEEAFAAAWAAAYKAGQNVWLYADITGLTGLESDLTVKPVLNSAGSALSNGTITYTVG